MFYVWAGSCEEFDKDEGTLIATAEHLTIAVQSAILWLHRADADMAMVVTEDNRRAWHGAACDGHYHFTMNGKDSAQQDYQPAAMLWEKREKAGEN